MHILREMQKVMSKPKAELSPLVPKVETFKIPQDKIGAIIGTGGKIIKEIIEKTNTEIDIEDDGTVKIFGVSGEGLEQSIRWVRALAGMLEKGAVYKGIIKKVADFGVFVEIAPGKDGLLHISHIPKNKQAKLHDNFKLGATITVKIVDYDDSTGRISLALVE